jgi:hypothetical protein
MRDDWDDQNNQGNWIWEEEAIESWFDWFDLIVRMNKCLISIQIWFEIEKWTNEIDKKHQSWLIVTNYNQFDLFWFDLIWLRERSVESWFGWQNQKKNQLSCLFVCLFVEKIIKNQ